LAVHKLWVGLRGDREPRGGLPRALLSWAVTFLFVLVTWVFFRAADFPTAWAYLRKMAFIDHRGIEWYYVQAMVVVMIATALHIAVVLRDDRDLSFDLRRPLVWGLVVGVLIIILLYAPFGNSPFIYFQF
jgi:alginate O-acetyltransferase complex protein AlgI